MYKEANSTSEDLYQVQLIISKMYYMNMYLNVSQCSTVVEIREYLLDSLCYSKLISDQDPAYDNIKVNC